MAEGMPPDVAEDVARSVIPSPRMEASPLLGDTEDAVAVMTTPAPASSACKEQVQKPKAL